VLDVPREVVQDGLPALALLFGAVALLGVEGLAHPDAIGQWSELDAHLAPVAQGVFDQALRCDTGVRALEVEADAAVPRLHARAELATFAQIHAGARCVPVGRGGVPLLHGARVIPGGPHAVDGRVDTGFDGDLPGHALCRRLLRRRVSVAPQDGMRGLVGRHELNAFVAQRPQVEPLQQRLSPAKQHRRDRDVQFVDKAFTQVLPDGVGSAADPHVLAASGIACPFKRIMDAAGDEVERCATFHLDRRPGMVGQNEDRNVVGRIVAPPAFPGVVLPLAAHGGEHVAPQNPCANILKAARGEIIVNPRAAAVLAEQRALERAGRQQPLVQLRSAHAERIIEALVRARSISVERDG
jgi:transposase InsO family protein